MTNREKIEQVASKDGLIIGCWDNAIESLSQKELKKVLENVLHQCDTDVQVRRKKYVVEIDIVDNEVDLSMITKDDYIDRYGNDRYEN